MQYNTIYNATLIFCAQPFVWLKGSSDSPNHMYGLRSAKTSVWRVNRTNKARLASISASPLIMVCFSLWGRYFAACEQALQKKPIHKPIELNMVELFTLSKLNVVLMFKKPQLLNIVTLHPPTSHRGTCSILQPLMQYCRSINGQKKPIHKGIPQGCFQYVRELLSRCWTRKMTEAWKHNTLS